MMIFTGDGVRDWKVGKDRKQFQVGKEKLLTLKQTGYVRHMEPQAGVMRRT